MLGRLKIWEENILSMKIRANDIDLVDAELIEVFSFSLVLFSFLLKQQYLLFAVDNDARKAVETFCIYKINIVVSNFHARN